MENGGPAPEGITNKIYEITTTIKEYLIAEDFPECGQGSTDDELSPACVSSLLGIRIEGVAAGLWHTLCISADGDVYAFGGNQFGQLGTGGDQAETLPRLLDAPSLENVNAKVVSCGARHSAIVTGSLKEWIGGSKLLKCIRGHIAYLII